MRVALVCHPPNLQVLGLYGVIPRGSIDQVYEGTSGFMRMVYVHWPVALHLRAERSQDRSGGCCAAICVAHTGNKVFDSQ